MPLEIKKFLKKDLDYCSSLSKEAQEWVKMLINRAGHTLFIARPSYGDRVWADGRLQQSAEHENNLKQPIGLVLDGTLEVTERFGPSTSQRVRTTKILQAGDFFGLFESFGGLSGQWDITAGVQRFFISNRLGDSRLLSTSGWYSISDEQLNTFQHRRNAQYDYSELIHRSIGTAFHRGDVTGGGTPPWHATIMLLDTERLKDNEALLMLLKATIGQLVSLARQNPPDALYEGYPEINENAEQQRAAAALDAILSDDIPLFSLYRAEHTAYGPLDRIKNSLEQLLKDRRVDSPADASVHIWVPEYFSKIGEPGGLYIDALAGLFNMENAIGLLKRTRESLLRSKTCVVPLNSGDKWSVQITTRDKRSAIIQPLTINPKELRLSESLSSVLFPKGGQIYSWPRHLSRGFLVQRVA